MLAFLSLFLVSFLFSTHSFLQFLHEGAFALFSFTMDTGLSAQRGTLTASQFEAPP